MDERTRIELVELWPQLLPGCYEALDGLLARRTSGGPGRPEGKLPVSAVYLYLYDTCRSQQKAGMLASELTACWMWQRFGATRAFDPEHTALLARQAAEDGGLRLLPAENLMALPRPITYCKTPRLLEMMDGFFCWVNEETARPPELRIQWLSGDRKHSVTQVLPLRQGATLRDCFWAACPKAGEPGQTPEHQQAKKMADMLWKAIPFVLRLMREDAVGRPGGEAGRLEPAPLPAPAAAQGPAAAQEQGKKSGFAFWRKKRR